MAPLHHRFPANGSPRALRFFARGQPLALPGVFRTRKKHGLGEMRELGALVSLGLGSAVLGFETWVPLLGRFGLADQIGNFGRPRRGLSQRLAVGDDLALQGVDLGLALGVEIIGHRSADLGIDDEHFGGHAFE